MPAWQYISLGSVCEVTLSMKEQSELGSYLEIVLGSIHYWRRRQSSFTDNSNKLNITERNLSQIILTTGQLKNPTTFPLTLFCLEITCYRTKLKAI